jgi:hypothetical protein
MIVTSSEIPRASSLRFAYASRFMVSLLPLLFQSMLGSMCFLEREREREREIKLVARILNFYFYFFTQIYL